jgi:hypothetical protein
MGLNGYGTRGMLKKRLNKHFEYLKEDDKVKDSCMYIQFRDRSLIVATVYLAARSRRLGIIDTTPTTASHRRTWDVSLINLWYREMHRN